MGSHLSIDPLVTMVTTALQFLPLVICVHTSSPKKNNFFKNQMPHLHLIFIMLCDQATSSNQSFRGSRGGRNPRDGRFGQRQGRKLSYDQLGGQSSYGWFNSQSFLASYAGLSCLPLVGLMVVRGPMSPIHPGRHSRI